MGILQIIGAAYGLQQVTAQVIKLINRQTTPHTMSVLACDEVFGDSCPGNTKMLTVVYCYDGGPASVATAMEGQTLSISMPHFDHPAKARHEPVGQPALTVWGASYGPGDASAKMCGQIGQPAKTSSLIANDDTFSAR